MTSYARLAGVVGIQGTVSGNSFLFYDYTMPFIGCDPIQTCSFVSERFQSHTMIYCEFKRIGQTNCTVQNQPYQHKANL